MIWQKYQSLSVELRSLLTAACEEGRWKCSGWNIRVLYFGTRRGGHGEGDTERGTRRGGHGEGADLLSTRGFAVIFHSKVPHEMIS